MNHCYDCNSGYTQPGTCNCFAAGGKRAMVTTRTTTLDRLSPIGPLKMPAPTILAAFACEACASTAGCSCQWGNA
jgi:hypothetical protein